MTRTCTAVLGALLLLTGAFAESDADCSMKSVINNGVCIDKNGKNDCSKHEALALACYSPDPQYTTQAAIAQVKGTVRLKVVIDTTGCAQEIQAVSHVGYGLEESAISALRRWRFRRPAKAITVWVELNFDPGFSHTAALTGPSCTQVRSHAP